MANVHYVIKVIEPNKEYLKEFIDPKLENCKSVGLVAFRNNYSASYFGTYY